MLVMDPIAAIGFAFKLPQEAVDDSAFCDVLENRRNLMMEWPASRGTKGTFYDGGPGSRTPFVAAGPIYSRKILRIANGCVQGLHVNLTIYPSVVNASQFERGQIGLEDDPADILPGVAASGASEGGMGNGNPVLKKWEVLLLSGSRYTFLVMSIGYERLLILDLCRLLLSRSSGHGYPHINPELLRYVVWEGGSEPRKPLANELSVPLPRQPWPGWGDGSGADWAGQLVKRLSGLSLEKYMRASIRGALGMRYVRLSPSRPEIQSRKVGMSLMYEEVPLVPTAEDTSTNMVRSRTPTGKPVLVFSRELLSS
ncbi:hypothetical protein DL767_001795 [Monosporascus sp. MG133]|nr:hypothetical protein DL767_001795 [Monosporascus sp. MG133]